MKKKILIVGIVLLMTSTFAGCSTSENREKEATIKYNLGRLEKLTDPEKGTEMLKEVVRNYPETTVATVAISALEVDQRWRGRFLKGLGEGMLRGSSCGKALGDHKGSESRRHKKCGAGEKTSNNHQEEMEKRKGTSHGTSSAKSHAAEGGCMKNKGAHAKLSAEEMEALWVEADLDPDPESKLPNK